MENLCISTSVNMTRKFDNEIYSFRKAYETNWNAAFDNLSQVVPKMGHEGKWLYFLLDAIQARFSYVPVASRLVGPRRLEIILGGAVWGDSPKDARELTISLEFAPRCNPCDNVEAVLFEGDQKVLSKDNITLKEALFLFEM